MQKAYIRYVLPNDCSSICTPAPYAMFKHSMQQSVSSTSTSQERSLAVITSDGSHLNIGAIRMLFVVLEVEEEVQRMFTAPHRAQFAVGLTCSHNAGTDTDNYNTCSSFRYDVNKREICYKCILF